MANEVEEFPHNEILCFNPGEPIAYLNKEDYERFFTPSIKDSDQVDQLPESQRYKMGYENFVMDL